MSRRRSKKAGVSAIGILIVLAGLIAAALHWETWEDLIPKEASVAFPGLSGKAQVYFLDVGQGDSELIRLPGEDGDSFDILIDAGTRSTKTELSDVLKELGVEDIEVMIGTHPHEDHIGGMAQILNDFPVDVLYLPQTSDSMTPTTKTYESLLDAAEENNVPIKAGKAGEKILEKDDVTFTILSPSHEEYSNLNDYSIVTRLTVGETAFLFQGDAEADVEEEILSNGYDLSCDVIKLGHHGSSTSSSKAYIEAASPSAAVISCGEGNEYGHPHEETLELLKEEGITVYRTDTQQTLLAETDGKKIQWTTGLASPWKNAS